MPKPSKSDLKGRARAASKATAGSASGASDYAGRIARLEKKLGRIQGDQAKRMGQLERLRDRESQVNSRLEVLRATSVAAMSEPVTTAASSAPRAYCMRERQMVEMRDPELVIFRNGRRAIAGTCAGCGTHVVAIVALVTATDELGDDGGPIPS